MASPNTTPTNEPGEVTAGDTLKWDRSLSEYPASTWTLTYYFRNATEKFDVTASASGDTHQIRVAKATSAAYQPGTYTWRAFATDGTSRFEVDKGTLVVRPDYATAGVLDDRSHARKMLDAIRAVLQNRATKDQASYSIGGRSLSLTPLGDLMKWEAHYKAEALREERAERVANGLGHKGRVLVRM